MAEDGVGTRPQVFVVDSHANCVSLSSTKKPRWAGVRQKFILPLVGLTLLGLVVEGFFIYKLYKQNEALVCKSSLCQNLSTPESSAQKAGSMMGQVGPEVQPHLQHIQQKAFAHLMGPDTVGETNIVEWVNDGDAIIYNMSYNNGRLLVKNAGYYYLYSKLQLDAAEKCSLIQHTVMRETKAYDTPLELMKSKSFHCLTLRPPNGKNPDEQDLWQSFLAGIFKLDSGDKIFVKLENIKKMRPGPTDNFMGAFMISP
ncbi:tumor necrosis factor ligand superfamily member 14-like [Scomber japonicus]|uniref:tumor necrosis factor ligand superfamily member 14-like n=1 Tax=Scomber japonicus TaxID=13676 RepID=UPI002305223F|nr:tumor necrosis factor ligand superfamily member 14-like [Scomber japonicus]